MATIKRSDEKLKNPRCRLVHFKDHPRPHTMNGNRAAMAKSLPPEKHHDQTRRFSVNNTPHKSSENYENLLIFYLTKLKNLFSNNHPEPTARENSAAKMDKLHHNHYLRSATNRTDTIEHPYRYTSSNPPKPREDHIRSKVYNVVSAALEYGCANDILEKQGDFYCLRSRRVRHFTPCPSRYCERCCNIHKLVKGRPNDDFQAIRSNYQRDLHHTQHGKVGRNYREHSNNLCCPNRGKLENNRPKVLHCPECRALERVHK